MQRRTFDRYVRIVGSKKELARLLGITPRELNRWQDAGPPKGSDEETALLEFAARGFVAKRKRPLAGVTRGRVERLYFKVKTKKALARLLGLSPRTANKWLLEGPPKTEETKELLDSAEDAVKEWLEQVKEAEKQAKAEERAARQAEAREKREREKLERQAERERKKAERERKKAEREAEKQAERERKKAERQREKAEQAKYPTKKDFERLLKKFPTKKDFAEALGIKTSLLTGWLKKGPPKNQAAIDAYEKAKPAGEKIASDWESFKLFLQLSDADRRILGTRQKTGVKEIVGKRTRGRSYTLGINAYLKEGFIEHLRAWARTIPRVGQWRRWQAVMTFAAFSNQIFDIIDKDDESPQLKVIEYKDVPRTEDFIIRVMLPTRIYRDPERRFLRNKTDAIEDVIRRLRVFIEHNVWIFMYGVTLNNTRWRGEEERIAREGQRKKERAKRIRIGDLVRKFDFTALAEMFKKSISVVRKWYREGLAKTPQNKALVERVRREVRVGKWKALSRMQTGAGLTSDERAMIEAARRHREDREAWEASQREQSKKAPSKKAPSKKAPSKKSPRRRR